jgi:hypothetical protein
MQSSTLPQTAQQTDMQTAARGHSRCAVRMLYAFDDCPPDRLIRICRLLQKRGYDGDSAAYVMPLGTSYGTQHRHRFYLSVEECPPTETQPFPPTWILEEYGVRIAAASMLCCLDEHARCLCAHGAVQTLAALALS